MAERPQIRCSSTDATNREPWHRRLPARLLLWLLVGSAVELLIGNLLFSIWMDLGAGKAVAQWMMRSGILPGLASRVRLLTLSVPDWTIAVLAGVAIGRYVRRWPVKSAIACSLGLTYGSGLILAAISPFMLASVMKNFYEAWLLVPRLITIALLVTPTVLVSRFIARRRIDPKTQCTKCGYNLTGNISGICPECGKAIEYGRASPVVTASTDRHNARGPTV